MYCHYSLRHCLRPSLQLFDGKGHSGLLTSQMTPQWRAVRRAVASALSPQSLRSATDPGVLPALLINFSCSPVASITIPCSPSACALNCMSGVCRASFPKLRIVAQRLVDKIRVHGPESAVDMDLLCAQLSWDIIGGSRMSVYDNHSRFARVTCQFK